MTKIKITALTDKASDEEILAKLKKIGVKIKDKPKDGEITREPAKAETSQSGETLVETRVASTIIRRRVQAPPRAKEEPKEEKLEIEEKKAEPVSTKAPSRKKAAQEPSVEEETAQEAHRKIHEDLHVHIEERQPEAIEAGQPEPEAAAAA